ncbi:restriction endonuclease subunit S [Dyadobacter endophyticus]|uniref:restriction endonuclease subunit S n=1 Tax=Dyadobacter endophyticus TaxID=1749036 RepID=UPI003CE8751F
MISDKEIPAVRFQGFEEGWKKKKLEKICDFSKGRGYSKKHLIKSGCPIILYGRLYTKYQTIVEDVDTFVVPRKDSVYSKGNEVIVPSSGETAEDISRASAVLSAGIILGGDLNVMSPFGNISPIFLALSISNGNTKIELSKRAQGKSVVHLHNSDLKTVNLFHPCLTEQTQLGNYFKDLDGMIRLDEQKLQKIKNLKKTMLGKMFPKENSDLPEIRFNGFTDRWQKKKLGDIGSVAMNKRIFKHQTASIGEIPFYKIGTFGGNADAYISRIIFEEYKAKYPYPKLGDILISASGSIGRIVEYLGADEYFQDSNIVWLKIDKNVLNIYLKYFYSVVKWNGLEGSTIKRLYNNNILNTNILYPSTKEQQKIGEYFRNLDQLITRSEQKIEQLKHLRQAMLQKMFI